MSRIGLQLYTVRDAAAADLAGALSRAAELGFEGVELHDLHGHAPDEVRAMLDAHGLAVCGRHVGLEAAEDDLGGLAAELETLGTDRLSSPGSSPRARPPRRTPPWRASCVRRGAPPTPACGSASTTTTRRLRRRQTVAACSTSSSRRTVGRSSSSTSAGRGTRGPTRWCCSAAAGSRAPLVHVKDMRRDGGPVHVPLGRGDVDYRGLADAANRAGVEWLIVEQDETDGEAFEAVADSLARLRSLVEVPA